MQDLPPINAAPPSLVHRLLRSPLAWLCVLVALAYAPIFWGQIIFFRDPAHWNYPARAFVRHTLLSGHFPHWNPFVGLGVPVWANPLYGIFYPPNWLLLAVPQSLVASALTWQSAAHTLFGGIGVYMLAKQFRCGGVACLVGGVAWAFSGYTTSMWSAGLLLIADAWLPWVAVGFIAAGHSFLRGEGWVRALPKMTFAPAMALLCGEVFVAMMSVGFGALTFVAWATSGNVKSRPPSESVGEPPTPSKQWLRLAAMFGAGVSLAFMIAAIVILPARALVAGTPRAAGLPLAQAEQYSYHPIRLLELVAPDALGVPLLDYPAGKWAGEKAIDGAPLAFSSYLGAAVIGLALLALGRQRRGGWMLLGCWCFFLFVCFGRYTPVHALWRQVALPFQYMRYPEKYFVLLVGWTALLAALGFDRLRTELTLKPWRLFGLVATLLSMLLVIGSFAEPHLAQYVRGGALRGLFAVAGLLSLFWFRKRQPRLVAPLAVTVVALDLVTTLWYLQPFTDAAVTQRLPPAAKTILESTPNKNLVPRLYRSGKAADNVTQFIKLESFEDTETIWMLTLTPNLASVFGIATIPGYDAATLGALDKFWEEGLEFRATLLRLLAVEFALLPVKDPSVPDQRTSVYQPIADPVPGTRLYRVKDSLPRAYVAGATMVTDDKQTLFHLFTPEVASGQLALVAAGQGQQPLRGSNERAGTCTSESVDGNTLQATCEVTKPGLAVFVEQYSPGWMATVDGEPTKLLRVNHVMRGVPLQPGRHTIKMRYQPPAVVGAAIVSAAAFIALVALWLMSLIQRHKRDGATPTKKGDPVGPLPIR